jgi:hypothetical protein
MTIYFIQCVDQDPNGQYPFWSGKQKAWVSSVDDASRYTEKQRESYGDPPSRGVWVRLPCTRETFRLEYERLLAAQIKADPNGFSYELDEMPGVVWSIMEDLKSEQARMTPTIKKVAQNLGIEPKLPAIGKFLRGERETTRQTLPFWNKDLFASTKGYHSAA